MSVASVPSADPGIADLQRAFDALRAAFLAEPNPSYAARRERVQKLMDAILAQKDAFAQAISDDFGWRSRHESLIADVWTTINSGKHILSHLRRWMRTEHRPTTLILKPGRGKIISQPLGVVGVIGPWNYPLMLLAVPTMYALAAGNRVLIKPSEYSPRTSALFAELVRGLFPADLVHVHQGDVAVGNAFAHLPFDHLFFTGSPRVGKMVMAAAAENLVPVTLELGGKSPAILHPDYPVEKAAEAIAYGKLLNGGQSCVAPDYVLVRREKADAFVRALTAQIERMYPRMVDNPDYTSVSHERHRVRLRALVDDARAKGGQIVEINPAGESFAESPKMAPVLIRRPTGDMHVLQEEIFGPILPIVEVDSLDEAIRYVQVRARPLALYVFDHDAARVERILTTTHSGGVTVNDTMVHFGDEFLPLGGVGTSGMGAYHGEEGFKTFSHRKGVFVQSRINGRSLIAPPFGGAVERLLRFFVR